MPLIKGGIFVISLTFTTESFQKINKTIENRFF